MYTEQDGVNDKSNDKSIEKLQKNILLLIQLAHETKKFDGIHRNKSNLDLFRTFVNFCLAHCCNSFTWYYKTYNIEISNTFTESDEALAILLFENIVEDLMGT